MEIKIGFVDIFKSSGNLRRKLILILDYSVGRLICIFIETFFKTRKRSRIVPDDLKRILVIRPGGIGDAVLLLPALIMLKKWLPNARVDILAEKRNAGVFYSQSTLFDKIYLCDHLNIFNLKKLVSNQYDLAVDTEQWHHISAILAFSLSRYSIGFDTRSSRRVCYDLKIKYGQDTYEAENFLHLFENYFQTKSDFDFNMPFFSIEPELNWKIQKKLKRNKFITIHAGTSIAERNWSEHSYADLIDRLVLRGYSINIVGGKDVTFRARRIMDKVVFKEAVYNYAGKISLIESTSLGKESELFFGPDSGLLHLVFASGGRIVSLFSSGNIRKWALENKRHTIISKTLECSPCTIFGYTIRKDRCRMGCLDITVSDVEKTILNCLAKPHHSDSQDI